MNPKESPKPAQAKRGQQSKRQYGGLPTRSPGTTGAADGGRLKKGRINADQFSSQAFITHTMSLVKARNDRRKTTSATSGGTQSALA